MFDMDILRSMSPSDLRSGSAQINNLINLIKGKIDALPHHNYIIIPAEESNLTIYILNELLKKIPLLVSGKNSIKKLGISVVVLSHDIINKDVIILSTNNNDPKNKDLLEVISQTAKKTNAKSVTSIEV
jgi:hypothetical protein